VVWLGLVVMGMGIGMEWLETGYVFIEVLGKVLLGTTFFQILRPLKIDSLTLLCCLIQCLPSFLFR